MMPFGAYFESAAAHIWGDAGRVPRSEQLRVARAEGGAAELAWSLHVLNDGDFPSGLCHRVQTADGTLSI
jgi:hypothetical protein